MLLRHYLEQGLTKAEVARKIGVSRRTVYHWIETEQLDRDLDDLPVQRVERKSPAHLIHVVVSPRGNALR